MGILIILASIVAVIGVVAGGSVNAKEGLVSPTFLRFPVTAYGFFEAVHICVSLLVIQDLWNIDIALRLQERIRFWNFILKKAFVCNGIYAGIIFSIWSISYFIKYPDLFSGKECIYLITIYIFIFWVECISSILTIMLQCFITKQCVFTFFLMLIVMSSTAIIKYMYIGIEWELMDCIAGEYAIARNGYNFFLHELGVGISILLTMIVWYVGTRKVKTYEFLEKKSE